VGSVRSVRSVGSVGSDVPPESNLLPCALRARRSRATHAPLGRLSSFLAAASNGSVHSPIITGIQGRVLTAIRSRRLPYRSALREGGPSFFHPVDRYIPTFVLYALTAHHDSLLLNCQC